MIDGKKVSAIIQVRLNSNRLPGKALLDIAGKESIIHTIDSLKPSQYIDNIVLCTSVEKSDNTLAEFAKKNNINLYRGDLKNLITRYIGAAKKYEANLIFRFTGDCPFASYELADLMLESNNIKEADRTGLDTHSITEGIYGEVFTLEALEKLISFNIDFNYSEYLSFYFTNNPHVFKLNIIEAPQKFKRPEYRLTIDYKEDLEMFSMLYSKLKIENLEITYENILLILDKYIEISQRNSKIELIYESNKDLVEKLKKVTQIKL